MDSAAVVTEPDGHQPILVEDKGLKRSLGFFSTLVVGLNSTAPAYSLAAVLSGIVVAVGVQAPASLIVSFVPMFLIAASFYYMNRADPDCGTTFTWVSRSLGPWAGWIAGWAVCMTGVLVIGSLADVAAQYTFEIFGWSSAAGDVYAVTGLAVLFIVLTTTLCVIGTEVSANVQVVLSGIQILALLLFAAVALFKAISGDVVADPIELGEVAVPLDPATIDLSWFLPWDISSTSALTAGLLIGVFLYWGWESSLTLNEESEDANEAPGKAGILATVLLVITYVLVATAVVAYAGPAFMEVANEQGVESGVFNALATPVLGSGLGKIVLLAVFTSALASTQTTILPASRTSLSMARHKAAPDAFGSVSKRFFTPVFSTVAVGVIAIAWYVPLNLLAQGSLFDSLQALSLLIAFYYAINGIACFCFYRNEVMRSPRWAAAVLIPFALGGFLVMIGGLGDYYDWSGAAGGAFDYVLYAGIAMMALSGVMLLAGSRGIKPALLTGFAPLVGAVLLSYVLIRSVVDLADPANSDSGQTWLGVTPALVMGVGFLLVGIVLLIIWRIVVGKNAFFQRKREMVEPSVAAHAPIEAK